MYTGQSFEFPKSAMCVESEYRIIEATQRGALQPGSAGVRCKIWCSSLNRAEPYKPILRRVTHRHFDVTSRHTLRMARSACPSQS